MPQQKSKIILAIETSCDETSIAVLKVMGDKKEPHFEILSNIVSSQITVHAPWGGVVPNLAKREHERNLVPVLLRALKEAKLEISNSKLLISKKNITSILEREAELREQFLKNILPLAAPKIDAIAVTHGPGLEPALWVGINFAKALAHLWQKPLIPVNHMEGHVFSALIRGKEFSISNLQFPMLALLISGGHTELVLIKKLLQYKYLGGTRDDAVGEAFDKVAKMLGLGYPGGPLISKFATQSKILNQKSEIILPRPMLHSPDLDFSFSGLKTSVLYKLKELGKISVATRNAFCKEFENAAIDVLVVKTIRAAEKFKPKTIILGGGVSANSALRDRLLETVPQKLPEVKLILPEIKYTGDNAAMIAVAAYFNLKKTKKSAARITAQGTLSL
jgi:N6-L-threonylcarbamoyladenine synthase